MEFEDYEIGEDVVKTEKYLKIEKQHLQDNKFLKKDGKYEFYDQTHTILDKTTNSILVYSTKMTNKGVDCDNWHSFNDFKFMYQKK